MGRTNPAKCDGFCRLGEGGCLESDARLEERKGRGSSVRWEKIQGSGGEPGGRAWARLSFLFGPELSSQILPPPTLSCASPAPVTDTSTPLSPP